MNEQAAIAVVGAGQIGCQHIERICSAPAARLAAMVDPAPGALEAIKTAAHSGLLVEVDTR